MKYLSKTVLYSTLPLILSVVLLIIVGNYGVGRVTELRKQIAQAKQDKTLLTQKLETLRKVSAIVSSGSQTAAAALPDKNPALLTVSQLKNLASQNLLSLAKLKAGGGTDLTVGISAVDITFDVVGTRQSIISFLEGVEKFAPITLVSKVTLFESAGQSQATITVTGFWADLPKTIPAVNGQINELTSTENSTLGKINSLTQPQFMELPADNRGGRQNPFNK
jgi:hypothetical protein